MAQPAETQAHLAVINNQTYEVRDPVLTGRDVLRIGGFRAASDFSVVIYKKFGTQAVGLDETISLDPEKRTIVRVFRGDRLFRGILNEREFLWGDGRITALELRLIGQIADDQDLFLDSDGDRIIEDDGEVRLNVKGVERIRSGEPENRTVNIVLNGEQVTVDKGRVTFEELAKMAFPHLFGREQVCFTTSFSRGPKRRTEGTLLEGGGIRVIEGMVFNVSATDKS